MFVSGIPLFITISNHIKFITALMTKDQLIKTMIETVKEIKAHYAKCSFRIKEMRLIFLPNGKIMIVKIMQLR